MSVVMLHVGYVQNSAPGFLMPSLESSEIVIAVPVTYTSLFTTTAVIVFSTITPVTGGYLDKAPFSFTLSFAASLS